MGATRCLAGFALLMCVSSPVLSQNELDEDFNKLSRASTFFAVKLYKELTQNSSNLICSPLSISVALSMLNAGAAGNTFEEINSTLGFQFAQLNEQELLQGYHNMLASLTQSRDGYQYSLGNAQFVQDSLPTFSNYSRVISEDFYGQITTVNFRNEQQTLQIINDWVRNVTRGKITSILEQLEPLDEMALVNAVYFKGQWLTEFPENRTSLIDFFNENRARKTVDMMINDFSAKYSSEHPIGGSVVELPYKGNFFSMIFVLPEFGKELSTVEENLTPEILLQISDSLSEHNLTVGIPKIKLETTINLVDHLIALGIKDVFTDLADLHRISPVHLKVSQATHKATLELTEEGSEASAATAIITSTRTGKVRPYFWANRPFMFLLRHNPTNTICFMGKVVDV